MDPAMTEAANNVSARYRAQGVNPMDPDVRSKYSADVDAELAKIRPNMGAGAQTIGAPLQLTDNGRVGAGEAAWESLKGLVGPDIPPELRQRELDTATTTRGRDLAEIGQHNDATKQAVLDALVAGEMGTRQPSNVPSRPMAADRSNPPVPTVEPVKPNDMVTRAAELENIRNFKTSTIDPNNVGEMSVGLHMNENPNAGAGIGVQRRRATPSPYESYSYKPSPVEEFLDTLKRIQNPEPDTIGTTRRRPYPYGETGFDPATGQGYLPMNFEQMDTREPHPSRVGTPVTGTPLPAAELTPEAKRLREDIPFTARENAPGQLDLQGYRESRGPERVAELQAADRKFDANARQQDRTDKTLAELARAGFFNDPTQPVKLPPPPPNAVPLGPIGPEGMKMPVPPFPSESKTAPASKTAAATPATPKLSESLKSEAPSELVQPSKEPLPGQEPKVTTVEEPKTEGQKATKKDTTTAPPPAPTSPPPPKPKPPVVTQQTMDQRIAEGRRRVHVGKEDPVKVVKELFGYKDDALKGDLAELLLETLKEKPVQKGKK
jgi:hypothetical protein